MFPKSLTVLNSRCAHKQSCSVLATTSMFGDPCPGTHKYLEAHYQCISASQTSTTTNRPNIPWVLTNTPPLLANASVGMINPAAGVGVAPAVAPAAPPRLPTLPMAGGNGKSGMAGVSASGGNIWHGLPSSPGPPTLHTTLPGGRLKGGYNTTVTKNSNRHEGLPPPPPLHHHHHNGHHSAGVSSGTSTSGGEALHNRTTTRASTPPTITGNTSTPSNTRILTGVGGAGSDDGILLTNKNSPNQGTQSGQSPHPPQYPTGGTIAATSTVNSGGGVGPGGTGGNFSSIIRTINNINNLNAVLASDESDANLYCGPTNARNLFWNVTRVGDVNVQPCPDGATGIAKWRCVLMKRLTDPILDDEIDLVASSNCSTTSSSCEQPTTLANKMNHHVRHFEPTWHPLTPDLTQCRSLWLSNLEVRVNQRDSSLISIANDLSEVTSSKTLYGGDMLVTTKIIQIMSEKMFHDKETFPDQRQREAIILELLHGVVKTGSNLLDESQLSSWLDLNQEDQMRVATSLLTGLEYNAFLLADTIIRERNVVQKVKNILLSVRVLEAKNIQANEVFPDADQWQISDDCIELPRAALIDNSEGGLVRIVFAAFDRLESILKPSYDHFDMKSARSYVRNTAVLANDSNISGLPQQQQRMRILNSKVISASLGKGRHIQLSQPIKLVLRHLKTENVSNPTCVFWNYIDHAWSANGCNLEATNRTHSICMCDHLTNFAILMDVMDEHAHSLFTMFDGNMRILIYISISICLVFIVIALLTLKIFNGVFIKSARTSIYRSIYICLLFVEIIFLVGIEQTETSILCGFTTVFLHCAILSAISWFCFEAFQSYSTLTTDDMLLEVDQTSKVNCYYLLSYGLSLTIVAISLAINPNTYTQNDFCVLMEGNALFYATFVTPVFIFLLGAVGYSLLSWLIMCRKSRTTLKNKEHTRLANVRFDIRCSFIFMLLLIAVWVTAYCYLRRAKMDDAAAIVFGYLFVGFNTLMGLYIFAFHCIQNEKIRREYRKYVRQNSWLPKCLRCSKTSISSGIVGSSGGNGGGCGGGGGPICSSTAGSTSTNAQVKKSKLPIGTEEGNDNDNDEAGVIISAADDAIIASSDCELTEGQQLRRHAGGASGTLKGGVMPGSLVLQHGKPSTIIEPMQGHIVLERGGAGFVAGGSGTLRSAGGGGGIHTPSAGHTSPTSSAGSTHLIFGHGQKQQAHTAAGSVGAQEVFYHQPDYYHNWRQQQQQQQQGVKGATREYFADTSPPQQAHEFFYWTQKHNQHGSKKKRGSTVGSDSPSGSMHSRTTAASQQVLFYPSYKKTTLSKGQQQQQHPPHHYAEAVEAGMPAGYYQQQQHRRQPSAMHPASQLQQQYLQQHHYQQQQQQLSSDDEHVESAAHAHLLHLSRRAGPSQLPPLPPGVTALPYAVPPEFDGQNGPATQRYYRNKHSNCDLSHLQQHQNYDPTKVGHYGGGGASGESYYNQGSLGGVNDGPVYEEILSNRNSDAQIYDVNDENERNAESYAGGAANSTGSGGFELGRRAQAVIAADLSKRQNGRLQSLRSKSNSRRQLHAMAAASNREVLACRNVDEDADDGDDDDDSICDGDEDRAADEEDEEEDDDDEDSEMHSHALPQSDERMRRLMVMQDEDFKRRFQRQLQLQQQQQQPQPQNQAQQQHSVSAATVFGVSGGGGSVRSFKKTISPNKRMAVNELFGPPLPPANQHPMQKRQQQQPAQQLSPQSVTSTTSLTHLQQQPIGRNISAMLDENNTVRCYLEPLAKK